MAYNKTLWQNNSLPAINEGNLNKIEQGIYEAHENEGTLSNLNTTNKNNLVGAINEVNTKATKSFIQIKKETTSDFILGNYGATEIPLTIEEFKVGNKFSLVNGAVKNVSSENLTVKITYLISGGTELEGGYILSMPTDENFILMPFSYATSMGAGLSFTVICSFKSNDTIKLRVGKSSGTTVSINSDTRISVEEI